MVNKEKQQTDGFGLRSTDVRKKDNALVEAARIADKMAKWYAEFGPDLIEKIIELEEVYEGPTKEELKATKIAEEKVQTDIDRMVKQEEADKAKADKKAKLQAELDALG